jgi:fluoroacetyl-CoA thioesterase
MQDVLATGYIVGLFEWTCIRAINPYINWPHELTVGTYVNVSH